MRKKFKAFDAAQRKWPLSKCWLVGLFMALSEARTQGERFACACEYATALWPKRKRCGRTLAGFCKAVARLPREFFGCVRTQLQAHLKAQGLQVSRVGRWQVFALDGSKQNLPRTRAHELKFGMVTKATAGGASAPQSQVLAAVAMGRNVLWDWECGSALLSERELALRLIARLPGGSLLVLDAGFLGYEWARAVQARQQFFLLRVGANVRLWIEGLNKSMAAEWKDGEVWLWPDGQQKNKAPLVLRLIRLKMKQARGKEVEMWLVTNVLEESKLTRTEAAALYQKRWRANECTFRDWKCTLHAEKLDSRTPQMLEREQEFGLYALQLLQVATLSARKQNRKTARKKRQVSVARAQQVWNKAARDAARGKMKSGFKAQLVACVVDGYKRKSKKVRQAWPERKAHKSPKAPKLRRLTKRLKAKGIIKLDERGRKAS